MMVKSRVALGMAVAATLLAAVPDAPVQAKPAACDTMTGTVLMTYHTPDTIILASGKSGTQTPVFTMLSTTTYTRNGAPATFDSIRYYDSGYITYKAVYPSGALQACALVMTGPA